MDHEDSTEFVIHYVIMKKNMNFTTRTNGQPREVQFRLLYLIISANQTPNEHDSMFADISCGFTTL